MATIVADVMSTPDAPAHANAGVPLVAHRHEIVAWLFVAAAVVAFLWDAPYAHIDDAYIGYRYARNLAHGNGLVFNLGERVEGFTSLAWVLLVAGGMKLGFDAPVVSRALGMVSGSVLLVLSYVYAAIGIQPRLKWVAALTPWLLWSTTSFAYWATSGLETPLLCAAVTLCLILATKEKMGPAVGAAALATLTRPEGVFVLGLILAVHVWKGGVRRPTTWLLPGLGAALLAGVTIFRLVYFGVPLPNTFYAKTGSIPFFETAWYTLLFFIEVLAPTVLPAAMGAATQRVFRLGAACVGVTFLYVLTEGADIFGHSRFFLPAMAPIFAMSTRGALAVWEDRRVSRRLAVCCVPVAFVWYLWGPVPGMAALVTAVLVTLFFPPSFNYVSRVGAAGFAALLVASFSRKFAEQSRAVFPSCAKCQLMVAQAFFSRSTEMDRLRNLDTGGVMLNLRTCGLLERTVPPTRSIAAGGIGSLGYCFPGRIIDLFGLTDATIAHTSPASGDSRVWALPGHQRSNAAYVLSQRPDFIFIPRRDTPFLLVPAIVDLWDHPALDRLYAWDPAMGAYRLRLPR